VFVARVSDLEVQRPVLFRGHVATDIVGRDDGFHGAGSNYMMSQQYESLLEKGQFQGKLSTG
jgi:hypothetical protein